VYKKTWQARNRIVSALFLEVVRVMEGVILEGIVPARSRRGAADVRTEFWGM
jgi:hypothetical protein